MLKADILEMLSRGELDGSDLVREGNEGDWSRASEFAERSPAITATAHKSSWYARIGDKVYGPTTEVEIKTWISEGRLVAANHVRLGQAGNWRTVKSVDEFGAICPDARAQSHELTSMPQKQPSRETAASEGYGQRVKADEREIAACPPSTVSARPKIGVIASSGETQPRLFDRTLKRRSLAVLVPAFLAIVYLVASLWSGFGNPSTDTVYAKILEASQELRKLQNDGHSLEEIRAFEARVMPEVNAAVAPLKPYARSGKDTLRTELYYAGRFVLPNLVLSSESGELAEQWVSFDRQLLTAKFMMDGLDEAEARQKASSSSSSL